MRDISHYGSTIRESLQFGRLVRPSLATVCAAIQYTLLGQDEDGLSSPTHTKNDQFKSQTEK